MHKIKITLPGSIRSKKNSKRPIAIPSKGKSNLFKRFAKAGMKPVRIMLLPSEAYKKWEAAAREHAAFQYPGEPITEPVAVTARIFYKGQRPDLSGCLESVGDCLEGILFGDDGQIESWDGSRLFHDKDNPRTEVEITLFRGWCDE